MGVEGVEVVVVVCVCVGGGEDDHLCDIGYCPYYVENLLE